MLQRFKATEVQTVGVMRPAARISCSRTSFREKPDKTPAGSGLRILMNSTGLLSQSVGDCLVREGPVRTPRVCYSSIVTLNRF